MPYSQDGRPLSIRTAFGKDAVLVTALSGVEEMSRPFRFTLDLLSEDSALDAADVLGKPARVTIALPSGGERTIHALVSRFRQQSAGAAVTSYRAELVPWLWMLSLSTDCRIFQKMSVPDIVAQVFDDLGYADYVLRLVKDYEPREYCVQYRETHLDFVSRLLEEEGIFFFFEHEDERHLLVLGDSPTVARPSPERESLGPAPVTGTAGTPNNAPWRDDVYTSVSVERSVHPRTVTLSDYNYMTPTASLETSLAATDGTGELYDYPGGYETPGEGDRYARLRLESAEVPALSASGTSMSPALTSGCKVEFNGSGSAQAKGDWLILSVTHTAKQGGFLGRMEEGFTYENAFTLHPADVPWRPARSTPRPQVRGTQSALVVGKSGEEIWTDAQGRVKLHFYWDRRGKRNENSSCWVRCTSSWAGRGYGQFSVPRMGQEVLVDFLEGDPDRPVVVGRVFNAEQAPPNSTSASGGVPGVVSGMRSNTHKGGGFNAMTMDDAAGKEKISIHAQYDMDTSVGHDMTTTVTNNDTQKVTVNRLITVDGTHTETIKGQTSITISTGSFSHDVQTGTATIHVKGLVKENFDDSQTTTVAHNVTIDGGDQIKLVSGASSITLTKDGKITIHCKNLEVIGDVDIKVSAPKVAVTGGDEAKFGVGNQQMTCDKTKVNVSGAAINASAVGMHEITGALVKIN